jgi:hypothetical protein
MNYPATLSNPMLKRKPGHINPESIEFSNLNRPLWAPQQKIKRPITAITEKGKTIGKPLPITHNYYNASKAELLLIADSDQDSNEENVNKQVSTFANVNEAYDLPGFHQPLPIKEGVSFYALRSKYTNAKARESSLPSLGIDYSKRSSGMLTTTSLEAKEKLNNVLNQKSSYISPLKPMSAYWGKRPEPGKDPYDRRKVKQLDDISFESDNEPEEIKNYQRLPESVLTEENLKEWLTKSLKALNLNSHYWLKNSFLDKIGRMAPNLVELSIRGLNISSQAFIDMVKYMGLLKILDISHCKNLEEKAIINLADTNQAIVRFQAAACGRAITDVSLKHLIERSRTRFEILNINYWDQVTDEGLCAFEESDKHQIFTELYLNGLTKATNQGFSSILSTCEKTLVLLHMALNDQYELTGEVCKAISKCFGLQILDLTSWKGIGDDGLSNLASGTIQEEEKPVLVGLKKLKILKFNNLDMINDSGLMRLLKMSEYVTHLEISAWINLTEYFFASIGQIAPNLQFLDMNMIVSMTPKLFEEFKENNPNLTIRRFMYQNVDVKDNGLRRPLKLKGKKPKKAKKKGKKKKK